MLLFNVLGAIVIYGLQRLQLFLPLNPQKFAAVSPESSFNTAISFITNTNWQGYSGESTMGYLVQMAGLAVQNFLSAATGIAVAIALIRGFARHTAATIGNFWVDITRCTLYILLPLSAVLALALASQGVIQNIAGYEDATTVEKITYQNPKTDSAGNPLKDAAGNAVMETAMTQTQTLPMGPVASQEAIKELGTNGGGFYNANSAHPYENPSPLTNLLEMFAILLIPFALTYTFGKMVGDTRQGWVILAAMLLFVPLRVKATSKMVSAISLGVFCRFAAIVVGMRHTSSATSAVMVLLIANAGKVLTHRQILREVWGPAHADDGHYVRVYMGHLRQKLEDDPAQPRHILTETAVGYRLVQDSRS
jgi:K+-transporting ATPase ATPase A chain